MISMFQINDLKMEICFWNTLMYRQNIECIATTIYPEIASYDDKNDIKTLQFYSTLSLTISRLKQVNKWLQ